MFNLTDILLFFKFIVENTSTLTASDPKSFWGKEQTQDLIPTQVSGSKKLLRISLKFGS